MPTATSAKGAAKRSDEQELVQYSSAVEAECVRQLRAADGTILVDGADGADQADEVFDIIITTETPVLTPGGYYLVLSHAQGAIDMRLAKRGLSFLLEHGGENAPYKIDPDMHVGVVKDVRIENRMLKGRVRFGPSERARLTRDEFVAQVRLWISGGWLPLAPKQLLRAGRNGEPDTYVIPKWVICEASSVSVPADAEARLGRSAGEALPPSGESPGEQPTPKENTMKQVLDGSTVIEVADDDPRPAITVQTRSLNGGGNGEDAAARTTRFNQIVELCKLNGLEARAGEFIAADLSLDQVKARVLDARMQSFARMGGAMPGAETLVPLKPKDVKRFSFTRALRMHAEIREGQRSKYDGLEGEVHEEIRKLAGENSIMHRGGIFLPMRLEDALPEERAMQVRAASSMGPAVPTGGAEIVQNVQMEFIDLLRNRAMCTALGARLIPGMVGTLSWARASADPTVRWMGTNPASGATGSAPKFGFVMSTPKTLIGKVLFPRQLVNLSNMDVEGYVRNTLAIGHGLAFDSGAITGKGTDAEPLGLMNNGDVGTLAMGNTIPTWKLLRQGVGAVLKKNVPGDSLAYMATPELAAVLSATPKISGAASGFIWEGRVDEGQVGGYRGVATNQVPISGSDHGLLLGAWSNFVLPMWGALEFVTDNITYADAGQLQVISYQNGDCVCLRPEGFLIHTGARLS